MRKTEDVALEYVNTLREAPLATGNELEVHAKYHLTNLMYLYLARLGNLPSLRLRITKFSEGT